MKNALTVFRKEFYRVVSDKRLVFMAVFLPGLAIYVMYSFMGNAIGNEVQDIQEHTMIIYTENAPQDLIDLISADEKPSEFHLTSELTQSELEAKVLEGEIDLVLYFPTDFETILTEFQEDDFEIPQVTITYNPGERYSENSYWTIGYHLNQYRQAIIYERHGDEIYAFSQTEEHIVDEDKASGQDFAMLLPMLIVMFLFSGAMSIGPDSIAGEKERGTIATLLVTPIKRSELAIGKVLSLSVISLFSATSSFIGIILSLPKLMGAEGGNISTDIYGIGDYFAIFAVLLATVLVIVGIISCISAYAKNIKEATMLIMPVYFISIITGVSSMFSGEAASSNMIYLVPIYSSINMIISILTFEMVPVHFLVFVLSSLVYVAILIVLMTKLFQSEKVMFSK